MYDAPFYSLTSLGLGFSYSSLNQLPQTTQDKPIGQAGIKSYLNVLNGNLVIADHALNMIDSDGSIKLGFIYNSQEVSSECWQFSLKRLIQTPDGSTAIMREEDGHLTTYQSNTKDNYTAPALNNGTPFLKPHSDQSGWQWYHPKTQVTEYYDNNGLLVKRMDSLGRTTTFSYNVNQQIETITGPSGCIYKICRQNHDINIYMVYDQNQRLLQHYSLDDHGRIETTQLPSGYKINYQYNSDSTIKSITQDDGTIISLGYENENDCKRITTFQLGENISYHITYPTDANSLVATIEDNCAGKATISIDSANGLTRQTSKQTGFDGDNTENDTTYYQYNEVNQLTCIIKPCGGRTKFEYNGSFGLLSQKIEADGQVTHYRYHDDAGHPELSTYLAAKIQILNNEILTTQYIYDTRCLDGKPFLRFEVSPEGRVKEYLPDSNGNVGTIRHYLSGRFKAIAAVNMNDAYIQLQDWVQTQHPQQINLCELTYDVRGQIKTIKNYTHIDAEGRGIATDDMAYEEYEYDEFGHQLTKNIKLSPTDTATTNQHYDDLQRLTQVVDPLNQKTTCEYQVNNGLTNIAVLKPNSMTETISLDKAGLTTTKVLQSHRAYLIFLHYYSSEQVEYLYEQMHFSTPAMKIFVKLLHLHA